MPSEHGRDDGKARSSKSIASQAKEMTEFYLDTGCFRTSDIANVLGDPVKGVRFGTPQFPHAFYKTGRR